MGTKLRLLGIFSAIFLSLIFMAPGALAAPEKIPALVVKVDGDGTPKVRRKSGIESIAGVQQQIFPGDRIITDTRSTVELALNDGTIVRVGLNSEYRLDAAQKQNGFISWVFHLAKGSIRALVEKSPNKKDVRFRVNTPTGTMGVRGTELVFSYHPESSTTKLYTLEGRVEFGALNCLEKETCVEVKEGESSSISEGADRPAPVVKFEGEDIFTGAEGSGLDNLALFQDVKAATSVSSLAQAGDITAMLAAASEKMAEAQDILIGRDRALREAMHKAMADGTYGDHMKLAENFDDAASGKKKSKADRADEAYSGTARAKKFALAEQLAKSDLLAKSAINRALKRKGLYNSGTDADSLFELRKKLEAAKAAMASGQTALAESTKRIASIEQKLYAEKLRLMAATPITGDMAEKLAALPAIEEKQAEVVEVYQYKTKSCFLIFCSTKTKSVAETQKETKKLVENDGKCYETKQSCGKKMIPCDLSKGKICKPRFEDKCDTVAKEVACK